MCRTDPFRFIGDFETANLVAVCVTPVGVGIVTVGMVTAGMVTEGMALVGIATVGDSTVATGCSGCMRFTRWLRPNTLERPAGKSHTRKQWPCTTLWQFQNVVLELRP